MAGRFPVSLLLEAQCAPRRVNTVSIPLEAQRHAWDKIPAPLSEACVRPVRGPVCASMARHGGDNSQCPSISLDRPSVHLDGLISREQLQLCPAGFSSALSLVGDFRRTNWPLDIPTSTLKVSPHLRDSVSKVGPHAAQR
ncbi:hypothetical protein B0H13DRAFT_1855111 [Mycena leptocephala]|nr:hypothetical protein B0H13DRAFT_1855111 [Mycena leptocephala]